MERIMTYSQPTGSVAGAYRKLCANLLARLGERKLIEIAGLIEGENAGEVTANLAVALAQEGKRTLIIDCNLYRPKQHELFGLQNRGLTDCLAKKEEYSCYIQSCSQLNLFVMTAGAIIVNPAELLWCTAMQNMLNTVRESYDLILINAPAVNIGSDAVAVGIKTDGVVLVITNRKDKVEEAQKAKDSLLQANIPILGCVLEKA